MVIDMPRKLCRPKVVSIYESPRFSNDIDENIFLFEPLDHAVYQQTPQNPGHNNDIIIFGKKNHNDEFSKFKINSSSAGVVVPILKNILKNY